MRFRDPARLIRDARGVLENRERIDGQEARRRGEQRKRLGMAVVIVTRA